MKNTSFLTVLTATLFLISANFSFAQDKSELNWMTIQELNSLAQSKKWESEKRPIIVDLYTEWCGWCKKMDKNTFTDKAVIKFINENFYAVKFDAETKEDIQFGNQTFEYRKSGRRGTNMIAYALGADADGRMGYPTLAFLNAELEKLPPQPGYKTAEQLLLLLEYVDQELYKTTNIQDYYKQKGIR